MEALAKKCTDNFGTLRASPVMDIVWRRIVRVKFRPHSTLCRRGQLWDSLGHWINQPFLKLKLEFYHNRNDEKICVWKKWKLVLAYVVQTRITYLTSIFYVPFLPSSNSYQSCDYLFVNEGRHLNYYIQSFNNLKSYSSTALFYWRTPN